MSVIPACLSLFSCTQLIGWYWFDAMTSSIFEFNITSSSSIRTSCSIHRVAAVSLHSSMQLPVFYGEYKMFQLHFDSVSKAVWKLGRWGILTVTKVFVCIAGSMCQCLLQKTSQMGTISKPHVVHLVCVRVCPCMLNVIYTSSICSWINILL